MKKLSLLFSALAILLTDLMCIVVTYNCTAIYCTPGSSAPWEAGLLLAIPFLVGIAACAALAYFSKKKERSKEV